MSGHDEGNESTNGRARAIARPPPRAVDGPPSGLSPRPSAPNTAIPRPPPRPSSVGVPMPTGVRPTSTGMPAVAGQRPAGRVQTGSGQVTKGAGAELGVGQVFAGRYRITKQVGKGGMGAVYLATQEPLSRPVAIKVLHGTADQTTVARFQREARLIAQLQHPHIVGLIDFGEDQGRLYLVMEFIDGESLTALLAREQPLEPKRVVDIALQVAEALAVAHDMQVVHRDIKPDNIMILATAGGQDFVKMLDFGVAKIKRDGEAQNTVETKAGLIVGSLRYISPEQVENGEITPRTDIYSFGCVVYEMLAGRRVFEYPSPADCAIAHITEEPKPPTVNGVVLSGPLVDFIMRCLSKKQSGRPAHAREAITLLQACREHPVRNHPGMGNATLQHAAGGLDKAQAASTLSQIDRAADNPASRPSARPTDAKGLDSQIRRRPSMPAFEIVGGEGSSTSAHLQGVRLTQRSQDATGSAVAISPPPAKGRAWLWALIVIMALGVGFMVVMLLDKRDPAVEPLPMEAKPEVTDEVAAPVPEVVAEPEVAAEIAVAAAPDVAAEPEVAASDAVTDKPAGAMVVTEPAGATVLRDKKKLCTTPCLVPWAAETEPPLVRVSLKGYIDIDLQFVKADRGTEQKLVLRRKP